MTKQQIKENILIEAIISSANSHFWNHMARLLHLSMPVTHIEKVMGHTFPPELRSTILNFAGKMPTIFQGPQHRENIQEFYFPTDYIIDTKHHLSDLYINLFDWPSDIFAPYGHDSEYL